VRTFVTLAPMSIVIVLLPWSGSPSMTVSFLREIRLPLARDGSWMLQFSEFERMTFARTAQATSNGPGLRPPGCPLLAVIGWIAGRIVTVLGVDRGYEVTGCEFGAVRPTTSTNDAVISDAPDKAPGAAIGACFEPAERPTLTGKYATGGLHPLELGF
jgi:hypothetical protein